MTLTLAHSRPAVTPAASPVARDANPASKSHGATTFGSIMDDTLADRAAASSAAATGSVAVEYAAADAESPVSFPSAPTWANAAAVESATDAETVPVDAAEPDASGLDAPGLDAAGLDAAGPDGADLDGAGLDGTASLATTAAPVAGSVAVATSRSTRTNAFSTVVAAAPPGAVSGAPATADGAEAPTPTLSGAVQNGAVQNGAVQNGAAQNGAVQNGAVLPGAAQNGAATSDKSARSMLPDSVRLARTDAAAPAAPPASALPIAVPAAPPSVAPTPVATPVATPAPTAAPLTTQIMKPLFSLSSAGPGEHVLTISVTPDNLGPVTVRAHVTGEGIRVELFAPTDLARDALRGILPDLRRDLAGSGLNAQLDLSSDSQAGDPETTRQPRSETDGRKADARKVDARSPDGRAPDTPLDGRPYRFGSTQTIDILA